MGLQATEGLDAVLLEYIEADSPWAFEERISARTSFWEGYHISNSRGLAKNGHEPVKSCVSHVHFLLFCADYRAIRTKSNSTMWWRTTFKGM